jgi:glycosyltransferase involved in cell wall biosynthesis
MMKWKFLFLISQWTNYVFNHKTIKMELSIIIPLYNEEELITQLLDQIEQVAFPPFLDDFEVIIVDDCSTDRSFMRVEEYAKQRTYIRVYRHETNKGKGSAVKTGIKHSTKDTLIIQDADLELSPSDIPDMLRAMHQLNVEFINGSRYLPGKIRPLSSFKRYWGNRIFTNLTSILINVKLTDMTCGYKLIKKSLYERIDLKENRFGFEAELIIKALRMKKNNVAEVPVSYFPRNKGEGKKLNNMDGLRILKTLFIYGLLRLD